MELREQAVSGPAHEFEEFARDCVRLAEQADTPELREKLLNLAREWSNVNIFRARDSNASIDLYLSR
jgi:hypothetical protein